MAFITDYKEAIDFFTAHTKEEIDTRFIRSISPHQFEHSMIFTMDDGSTYHVSKQRGIIIHSYSDTWRNPEHREVVYDANEEVKKMIAEFNEWNNAKSEIKMEVY